MIEAAGNDILGCRKIYKTGCTFQGNMATVQNQWFMVGCRKQITQLSLRKLAHEIYRDFF